MCWKRDGLHPCSRISSMEFMDSSDRCSAPCHREIEMGPLTKTPDKSPAGQLEDKESWDSDVTPEAIARLKEKAGEILNQHEWEVVEGEPDS